MDATFETLAPRHVLGIRSFVLQSEIGQRIGEQLPELMAAAGDRAAGPPLCRWFGWEGDRGEMELAVAVEGPVPGSGRVKPSRLPGGPALVVEHRGPYDGLADTWRRVRAFMEREGHVGRDAPWECYLDDCSRVEPQALRTQIVWPIETLPEIG